MVTKVKICGVRTIEAAEAIKTAGADFAGLNFVFSSKRLIDLPAAQKIIEALGSGVARVGIFQDQELDFVLGLSELLELDYVQLHGREPPEYCGQVGMPIIKAIPVETHVDEAALDAYSGCVSYFLFDGKNAGSGLPFPWNVLAGYFVPRPYLIAGGLTPENVREAVAVLRPSGVDTASGVEVGGAQDPDRIVSFVKEARRA